MEDEYHFLMECTKYYVQRNPSMLKITGECHAFEHVHDEDIVIYMLCARIEVVLLCSAIPGASGPKPGSTT